MSNPHDASATAVYALLALRQPSTLAELRVGARSRSFPSAAPPPPKQGFAGFTAHARSSVPAVDGESSRRRGPNDPFLLNAPELRAS